MTANVTAKRQLGDLRGLEVFFRYQLQAKGPHPINEHKSTWIRRLAPRLAAQAVEKARNFNCRALRPLGDN